MNIFGNFNNKKLGFTFVELIITVTILTILSTLGILAYSKNLENSRDSKRESDLLSIQSSLKLTKEKRGQYPNPGTSFNITNNGLVIAKQGFFNKAVLLSGMDSIPLDPYAKISYFYSTTKSNQEFQLGTTLENNGDNKALIIGDYKSVSKNILPTLLLAINSTDDIEIADGVGSGSLNRIKFIFDNGQHNLPYNFISPYLPYCDNSDFDTLINDSNINYEQKDDFKNCNDIFKSGKNIGTGEYQVNSYGELKTVFCGTSLIPENCRQIKEENPFISSGTYQILPKDSYKSFTGYCDMSTASGGWTLVAKDGTSYNYIISHCDFSDPPNNINKEDYFKYWACDLDQSEILLETPSGWITGTYNTDNSCAINTTETNNNLCTQTGGVYQTFRITGRGGCMTDIYPTNWWIWWIGSDRQNSVTKNLSGLTGSLIGTCDSTTEANKSYCNLFDVYDGSGNGIGQGWGYRGASCAGGYNSGLSSEQHLIFVR